MNLVGKIAIALTVVFALDTAEAARLSRLPRLKLKSYETGAGSPKGFSLELNINCINLSPFEQKLEVIPDREEVRSTLLISSHDSDVDLSKWEQQPSPSWFNNKFDPTSLPKARVRLLHLFPMGDPQKRDEREANLGFSCVFKKEGPQCAETNQAALLPNFNFNRMVRQTDGTLECKTPTHKNCIKDASVYYEVTPKVVVDENYTRGAVLCSVYSTITLVWSENQASGEINMPFNGGNPF